MQETKVAGKDGKPATCVLYYSCIESYKLRTRLLGKVQCDPPSGEMQRVSDLLTSVVSAC